MAHTQVTAYTATQALTSQCQAQLTMVSTFSASVNIDAGTEVDTGDFELDGEDGGTAGLGAVSMTGTFGTLTFDDGGIENLYSDGLTNADVSYATTVGAVSLTVAHDTACSYKVQILYQLDISKWNGIHFNCFRSSWLEHQQN